MSRIVIQLMKSLDILGNDIVVIAATNRIDVLDEALLRRFTTKHEVKILSFKDSYNLVAKYLNDLKIDYNEQNICDYVKKHRKQSEIINDIIQGIIKMINQNQEFYLKNEKEKNNESND